MSQERDGAVSELSAALEGIRERVRQRRPRTTVNGSSFPLVDLHPILHARDAAEAKSAAIGSVNPRPPGFVNDLIQSVKQKVARALGWFVRDQVLYNQAMIRCVQTSMDALNDVNHIIIAIGQRMDAIEAKLQERIDDTSAIQREVADVRSHWSEWRTGWEKRQAEDQIQLLRSVSELSHSYQYRLAVSEHAMRGAVEKAEQGARGAVEKAEQSARAAVDAQHREFSQSLAKSVEDVQQRMWTELAAARAEQERLIHDELRVTRRRLGTMPPATSPAPLHETLDYGWFAERFRGNEAHVRQGHDVYRAEFAGCRRVLDLGCGRGEFLESLREQGISGVGVEASPELVALGRSKGLAIEEADLFAYLRSLDPGSFDGIVCSQVVEHLPPALLPELIKLSAAALQPGGVIAFETPNPECLAIFATHFYLDPTHVRPVPSQLMAFYLQEYGFHRIEVRPISPAIESMPSLATLPEEFRNAFFGALDYSIIARKL